MTKLSLFVVGVLQGLFMLIWKHNEDGYILTRTIFGIFRLSIPFLIICAIVLIE